MSATRTERSHARLSSGATPPGAGVVPGGKSTIVCPDCRGDGIRGITDHERAQGRVCSRCDGWGEIGPGLPRRSGHEECINYCGALASLSHFDGYCSRCRAMEA